MEAVPGTLFVYGTLAHPDSPEAVLGHPVRSEIAVVSGWTVTGVDGEPFAAAHQGGPDLVGRLLFDLTDDDLAVLQSVIPAYFVPCVVIAATATHGPTATTMLRFDATHPAAPPAVGEWNPDRVEPAMLVQRYTQAA